MELLLPSLQFSRKNQKEKLDVEKKEQIKELVQMEKKNVQVRMQALVLAMHTLSLIHEGTIL